MIDNTKKKNRIAVSLTLIPNQLLNNVVTSLRKHKTMIGIKDHIKNRMYIGGLYPKAFSKKYENFNTYTIYIGFKFNTELHTAFHRHQQVHR